MKQIWMLLCLVMIPVLGRAQLGVSIGYGWGNAPDWQMDLLTPPGEGVLLGLEYALPIKQLRMELVPGLALSRLSTPEILGINTTSTGYSAHLLWRIYPFDLQGDCNCPTFSRQGNLLQKGIWLAALGGVTAMDNRINFDLLQGVSVRRTLNVLVGVQAGIDLGLSERLTLSPFLGYNYLPDVAWPELSTLLAPELLVTAPAVESAVSTIQLGVRFYITIR
jgi:hypothetical protein